MIGSWSFILTKNTEQVFLLVFLLNTIIWQLKPELVVDI